jgi:D-glycero-beta-D-manno-heptose-7-phosphate kinase
MTPPRLRQILARFERQRILVVGDVMLDEFLWGKVSRISPEAPVPVVEVNRQSAFPGGAANVARNLRALGAPVQILGVTGQDAPGADLRRLLAEQGVETDSLLADPTRPTTVKTRIVAHHQQVVRFDREHNGRLAPALEQELRRRYRAILPGVAAVIFEDYSKGLFHRALVASLQADAHRAGVITAADPNPRNLLPWRGLTAVTPNRSEAFAAAGMRPTEPTDDVTKDEPLHAVGRILLRRWQPRNLLITLGEDGMCLFRRGHAPHHIPTVAREVFDVSGAGDTVIATLTLALAAGVSPVDAAQIANHAAGVVVGKVGTAVCSPAELAGSFKRRRS